MNEQIQVFQPTGILDGIKGHQLRQDINEAVEGKANIVLVDLEQVNMMDSSGLGALLSTMKAAKKAGCKFFLCSAHNQVNMLFELTKMDRVFEVFKSRDEFNAAMLKE